MVCNLLAIVGIAAMLAVGSAYSGCYTKPGLLTEHQAKQPEPGWAFGPTAEDVVRAMGDTQDNLGPN